MVENENYHDDDEDDDPFDVGKISDTSSSSENTLSIVSNSCNSNSDMSDLIQPIPLRRLEFNQTKDQSRKNIQNLDNMELSDSLNNDCVEQMEPSSPSNGECVKQMELSDSLNNDCVEQMEPSSPSNGECVKQLRFVGILKAPVASKKIFILGCRLKVEILYQARKIWKPIWAKV